MSLPRKGRKPVVSGVRTLDELAEKLLNDLSGHNFEADLAHVVGILRNVEGQGFRAGVLASAARADEWYENHEPHTPGNAILSDVIASEEVRNQDARSET